MAAMPIAKTAVVLLGMVLAAAAPSDQGFKVVASPDVALDSMSKTDLSDVFLKRTTIWPNGARIEPVDLADGVPAFETFCTAVHHKSGSVIRAFWKRVTLSGRDTAPIVKRRDEDVLAFVRSNSGAIGYVSASAPTTGVKVIAISGE